MNNAINEIKNTLEATNSRMTEAEDRISELKDRMVEINQSERKQEKWIKRNEDNLRDFQDNVKCPNIRIIGVPEEEDKKKDYEKIFEETIVENFPKMGTEIITQVQETQRVRNRINSKWNTPRHILIKLTEIKHKEQILKAAREKEQITHKGSPIRITADLSIETPNSRPGGNGRTYLKWWKKITYSPDYYNQQGSHSNMKEKSKALQTSKSWENSAPPNQLSNKC